MILLLTRDIFSDDATLSRLDIQYPGDVWFTDEGWIPNEFPGRVCEFGFACEDQDRRLDSSMSLSAVTRKKVKGETAIPYGEYTVRRTWSPKYGRLVMEVEHVLGFVGIRIHPGNSEADTAGCILPGLERDADTMTVSKSAAACKWLDLRVSECERAGRPVTLRVVRA